MKRELLRMDHVNLEAGGERLLDNLNFQIFAGEIMGLVSRSFKGHDQLIGLIGYNRPITSGTVWYDGKIVNSYSYSDGSANRAYVIEQKSHLVEGLSVVDNIFVLRSGFRKYFINEQVLLEQTERFFQENGIHVDISKRVNALDSLERCLVELGKALLLGCRLIIVDNPGNFLSQHELPEFQRMLRKVRDDGVAVLYIGNHHQEVFKIADRTSLFYDGQIRKVFERDEMTDRAIAPYIMEWQDQNQLPDLDFEDGVLHFHHVHSGSLNGLQFVLHKGECLTLLDMDNRIADDILGLLTGGSACARGRITLEHELYTPKRAARYLDEGVAVIPKDPVEHLLFPHRTYMENLTFLLDRKLGRSLIPGRIYRSIRDEYAPLAGAAIDETNILNLSLEEQMSLIYYRVQLLHPRVLICIQPLARGDMLCRRKILSLIRESLRQGTAVLITTTNVSDTLEISDRLMVVEGGVCTAAYDKPEFDRIAR